MSKELNSFFSRVYENFFMRDLSYIIGGSILLASVYFALDINLIFPIKIVTKNILVFFLFLGLAYIIGLIVKEGMCLTPIFKTSLNMNLSAQFRLMYRIETDYGIETIRRIERITYLHHIGSAVGSSTFISTLVILCIKAAKNPKSRLCCAKDSETSVFFILGALIVTTIVCIVENWRKIDQNREVLKGFNDKLLSYQKVDLKFDKPEKPRYKCNLIFGFVLISIGFTFTIFDMSWIAAAFLFGGIICCTMSLRDCCEHHLSEKNECTKKKNNEEKKN